MRSSTVVAERVPVSVISAMEDRKRAIPHDSSDDPSPPLKRQAVAPASSSTNHLVPQSQEDVIHFQKEAIFRQMLDYKRERNLLEHRVEQLDKKATYHDDHLRVMDAWWDQLVDEVRLLAGGTDEDKKVYQNGVSGKLPSSLLFDNVANFSEHLSAKRMHIINSLTPLFKSIKAGSSSGSSQMSEKLTELQSKVGKLLAAEKAYQAEIERLEKEKDDATTRLTEATIKYLTAEKKMDRLRSQSLAKIERQAMFNSNSNSDSKRDGASGDSSAKDKEFDAKIAEGQFADLEQARKEAQAIASKQKEEIQQLQADNTRLSEQVTNFTIKFGKLAEEDIASCDAYKNLKLKLDDLLVRFNHIEAENSNLKKASEKLEGERTEFKDQILKEQQNAVTELSSQLSKVEQDLARVRHVRDELVQEQATRQAQTKQRIEAIKDAQELAEIRWSRILSLEAEVNRLRNELAERQNINDLPEETANLSREQLLEKLVQVEKSYKALSDELPHLETAFKRAKELMNKMAKETEEKDAAMGKLAAEKGKADQKFFAAMKSKETLQQENRILKNQNSKSSEIIAQLKDAEKSVTHLVTNLEKQMTEMKVVQAGLVSKNREQETRLMEQGNTIESYKRQVGDITNALKSRDAALSRESSSRREAEIEMEKLQVRLDETTRTLESERSKGTENSQLEALRSIALCSVCKSRWKDTAIRTCGHVFCKQCAEERITSRSRKCPNCARAFAATDIIPVYLGV